jgi:hypothetical protein
VDERPTPELRELALADARFRAPMVPISAEIVLAGGKRMEVTLFLLAVSPSHPGVERVEEVLSSNRQFLPLRRRDTDQCILVYREAIVALSVATDSAGVPPSAAAAGATLDIVQIEMAGGLLVQGALCSIGEAAQLRISDLVNQGGEFIRIDEGGRITYLNKRHIVTIVF